MQRVSVGLCQLRDSQSAPLPRVLLFRPLASVFFFLVFLAAGASRVNAAELANDTISLDLEITANGIPTIAGAKWISTGKPIFTDAGLSDGLSAWMPESLLPGRHQTVEPPVWSVSSADRILTARATLSLPSSLKVTWVVELAKQGSLFRLHVDYQNVRSKPVPVQWFPTWSASWTLPASPDRIRWWDAMAYTPEEKKATKKANVDLFSHLYSSAANGGGSVPYWVVDGQWGKLYFGLSWSGGWHAQINSKRNLLTFSVNLPPDETQLSLEPGERVEGPRLLITPTRQNDDMAARRWWMYQRSRLGQDLYGGPAPAFPLAYNHWYAVRMHVDADFIANQIGAMGPYSFDAFIIDDGWFDRVGNWVPNLDKFEPGELEGLMRQAKASGSTPGLWSAPQYAAGTGNQIPAGADIPPVFNSFVDGYLLDLWNSRYRDLLTRHVQTLAQQFSIGWWKYDQPIFSPDSDAGPMKNVLAFQSAVRAVRRANPNLIIENCEEGGQMISEFTLLTTQLSWLLDLPGNDLPDARSNIQVALGALEFMFPWSAYRWTNRLDEHGDDDEFTRFYCRSAMAGVWGISSDLTAIGDHQRSVVLNEIRNYRRLNAIKKYNLYEVSPPTDAAETASVTFYGRRSQEAAVLIYRWNRKGAFDQHVGLRGLDKSLSYVITDADQGTQTTISGQQLTKLGFVTSFASDQLSALLFIEPVQH